MPIHDIRDALPADRDTLLALSEASGLFEPGEVALMGESLDAWAGGSEPAIWLIETADTPGGATMLAPEVMSDRVWNLLFIGVAPARRRSGLASALLAAAEARVRREGGRMLLIDTASVEDQAPARAFYESAGYDREARIRDYYGDGIDRVTYRRRLSLAD